MSSKADRTLTEALGHPDDDVTKLDFTATTASGILDPNTTYRFAATEDCYFRLKETNDGAVSSADTLFFGGIPEIFQTTSNAIHLGAIRVSADGSLYVTKMKTAGK